MSCLFSGSVSRAVLFGAGFFVAVASAEALAFGYVEKETEKKEFVEDVLELPPSPEKADLIPFVVSADPHTQYLIDGRTLSVGSDGVVRYVLVAISSEGARNVSYEGIRCATGERRFYASGRSDGSWAKARSDKWLSVKNGAKYLSVLSNDYFCPVTGFSASTSAEARDVLQRGGVRVYDKR